MSFNYNENASPVLVSCRKVWGYFVSARIYFQWHIYKPYHFQLQYLLRCWKTESSHVLLWSELLWLLFAYSCGKPFSHTWRRMPTIMRSISAFHHRQPPIPAAVTAARLCGNTLPLTSQHRHVPVTSCISIFNKLLNDRSWSQWQQQSTLVLICNHCMYFHLLVTLFPVVEWLWPTNGHKIIMR